MFVFSFFLVWFAGSDELLQRLEQPEEARRLADPAELDAERLHLDEEVLDVDDLVADQRLQKHAHQSHEAVLHVLVLDVLARRDAVRDVQMNKLSGKINGGGEPINNLHGN